MEINEEMYKSFKDLMKKTYDKIFSEENKKLFTIWDAFSLILFSMALDSLNAELYNEIKKSMEE